MVLRQVDDAEAADTKYTQDLQLAETRARRQRVMLVHWRVRCVSGRVGRVGSHEE